MARANRGWGLGGLVVGLAGLVAVASCDGDGTELGPGAGAGGNLGLGGSGGGVLSCDPPCVSPQFCSMTGVCLDEGRCAVTEDCAAGTECDPDQGICVPGGECGQEEFGTTAVPPNLLIVLDRTGSMSAEVPDSGGLSRWEVAGDAVASVLQSYEGTINFGLNLFSACTGNGCAPGTIVEPIGSAAVAIDQAVSQASLCNSGDPETVIGGTLAALVGESSLQAPGRDNVVLLLTDGHDNCGGGGAQAATDLLGQPVPVQVYVVGFSGGVDAAELEAIAQAAGTDPYYQADDAAELSSALQTIAGNVKTCSFQLDETPDAEIFVFFNNDPSGVPNDPNDGWTYDDATNTVTFHGAACDDIENGDVDDIDIVFGCDAPTPD